MLAFSGTYVIDCGVLAAECALNINLYAKEYKIIFKSLHDDARHTDHATWRHL